MVEQAGCDKHSGKFVLNVVVWRNQRVQRPLERTGSQLFLYITE